MFLRTAHRLLSITLATVLTLGMLGAVNGLSQPASAMAQGVAPDSSVQA